MAIEKPIFVEPLDLEGINGGALPGYPASNLNRLKQIGLAWRGTSGGTITGTFSSAKEVDFIAMLSANAAAGTTIRFQGGGYDSTALPFISPSIVSPSGLYHSFHRIPAVKSVTSWTVTVAHTGVFESAFLVMGKAIDTDRFYNRDFERGVEDLGKLDFTRWAVPDEEPGLKMRTLEFALDWESEAKVLGSLQPMGERLGTTGMVYCCFRPEATVYRQGWSFYGNLSKPLVARGRPKPTIFGQDLVIRSLI